MSTHQGTREKALQRSTGSEFMRATATFERKAIQSQIKYFESRLYASEILPNNNNNKLSIQSAMKTRQSGNIPLNIISKQKHTTLCSYVYFCWKCKGDIKI